VTAPAAIESGKRARHGRRAVDDDPGIADYRTTPNDGYLSELFEMTDVQFDLTAHITPKNQERARNELQDIADDLQVDADLEQSVRAPTSRARQRGRSDVQGRRERRERLRPGDVRHGSRRRQG